VPVLFCGGWRRWTDHGIRVWEGSARERRTEDPDLKRRLPGLKSLDRRLHDSKATSKTPAQETGERYRFGCGDGD
jgi:hypothetical protein